MYQNQPGFVERISSSMAISERKSTMIKQTYLLLGLSVIGAVVGATVGSSSPGLIKFFSSGLGWIAAMLLLNVMPQIAYAMRHRGIIGVAALALDGFFAGLVLGPLLYVAQNFFPGLLTSALIITGIIFASVTGFVMTSGRTFSAPRGLMVGMFFSIVGITALNLLFNFPLLSLLISGAIGIFGLFVLVFATSQVLDNAEADSPIPGALMLFAGLFQVFQAVVSLLMAFTRR